MHGQCARPSPFLPLRRRTRHEDRRASGKLAATRTMSSRADRPDRLRLCRPSVPAVPGAAAAGRHRVLGSVERVSGFPVWRRSRASLQCRGWRDVSSLHVVDHANKATWTVLADSRTGETPRVNSATGSAVQGNVTSQHKSRVWCKLGTVKRALPRRQSRHLL